jgi:hypothetical protein
MRQVGILSRSRMPTSEDTMGANLQFKIHRSACSSCTQSWSLEVSCKDLVSVPWLASEPSVEGSCARV